MVETKSNSKMEWRWDAKAQEPEEGKMMSAQHLRALIYLYSNILWTLQTQS